MEKGGTLRLFPDQETSAPEADSASGFDGVMQSSDAAALDRWYWDVLVAVPYLLAMMGLALALRHNVGFPLDDSWIHQVIARNLVFSHSWGFTPGVTSSGSSSTLWTLVLAVQYLIFPHSSPVFFPLIVNAFLLAACGVLLWRMARLDGLSLPESVALGVLPALSGNLDWLAFTGMEHVLFMALSLLSIVLWFRKGSSPMISAMSGLSMGLLGITRPEGLGLCLALLVIYRWCGRTVVDAIRAAVVAMILIVPSFLLNLKTSGTLLPMTLKGRRFLYSGTDKLHVGRSSFRALILDTAKQVISHHFFHTHSLVVLVPATVLAIIGLIVIVRRLPNRTSVICLWAVLDYCAYCVTLPVPGHGGRYQPFVLLLFPSLLAVGLISVLSGALAWTRARRMKRALSWTSVAIVAGVTSLTLPRWESALHDSVADIEGTHVKLAHWINQNYAPGTTMAVFDIGAIGYYAHIHIVDLGGLVDRNYLPYLIDGRVPEYLNERGIRYVVLPHTNKDTNFGDLLHLLHNPAVRLVPIHTEAGDVAMWENGLAYTGNAHRQQTLYRIEQVPKAQQNPAETDHNTCIAAAAMEGVETDER
jgi:hypothetical protein